MIVNLRTANKRVNSTGIPAAGTDCTGRLVEPCDIVNPVIKFENKHTNNYAYISEFGRYYWIDDWTFNEGFWTAQMHCDVLATYKATIGSASRYVLRSAAAFDGAIMDIKYPTKSTHTSATSYAASGWSLTTYGGRYVVGVITPNGTFGSTAIYCLTNLQFAALRSAIMTGGDAYYNGIQDTDLKNLAICISDPMQYITFCRYYPFAVSQGTQSSMKLGKITVDDMNLIDELGLIWGQDYTFDLTAHPLAATRGEYLNTEPFTRRYISFEPLGLLEIPGSLTQGATTIGLSLSIDVVSGAGKAIIKRNNAIRGDIYRTDFVAGVDMPIAQMISGNPLQVVSSVVNLTSGIASAMTGNITGAISGGMAAVSDFIGASTPQVQAYKAGTGSLLQNEPEIIFKEFFQDVVDEDNTEYGRPLCEVRQLSTLSGYQLVRDGDIPITGTAGEQEQIRNYLESGYFYE